MPYRTEWAEPEVFLEHEGVTVYHVYADDDYDQGRRDFWFTTSVDGSDTDGHGENGTFCVQNLPKPSTGPTMNDQPPTLNFEAARKEFACPTAIDWQRSHEFKRRTKLWEDWWANDRLQATINTVEHAINIGVIKVENENQLELAI